jgi:hypothetical protein
MANTPDYYVQNGDISGSFERLAGDPEPENLHFGYRDGAQLALPSPTLELPALIASADETARRRFL